MVLIDLAGKAFGRLTVIERDKSRKTAHWRCLCLCGAISTVSSDALRSGRTRSCGCYMREFMKAGEGTKTHGRSGTPEHKTWKAMRRRCLDVNDPNYQRYGAVGIGICEWWSSFEAFFADMGPKPTTRHSIDRIDNYKGYSPENCRWATASEQRRNQKKNIYIEYQGNVKTLADWCDSLELDYGRTIQRIRKLKWSADRAFTAPKQGAAP